MRIKGLWSLAAALAAVPSAAVAAEETNAPASAQAAVDDLLTADRAFAAESAGHDMLVALPAMYDEQIVVPLSGGRFARGKAAASEALAANPDNAGSRVEWTPVRGGVSADGQHGFTFGYMTTRRASGAVMPGKYLAYWVKRPEGWRVLAYKRALRPEGAVSTALLAPSLPARLTAVSTDAPTVERYRASLAAAEKSFSDEAQQIGIGPAFAKNGHADAVNMGASAAFTIGSGNIAKALFGEAKGSPVHWDAGEGAVAASSGDLGVTWGLIQSHAPPPDGQPAASAFFTIWRRDSPSDAWRYIAE